MLNSKDIIKVLNSKDIKKNSERKEKACRGVLYIICKKFLTILISDKTSVRKKNRLKFLSVRNFKRPKFLKKYFLGDSITYSIKANINDMAKIWLKFGLGSFAQSFFLSLERKIFVSFMKDKNID